MGASELKDFRPICLIGNFYEIISKILIERLKKFMPKLVDGQQMVFIKDRKIMDAILVANEYVDMRYRSKVPGILCKLESYDHLNWEYMWSTLRRMDLDKMVEVLYVYSEVFSFDQWLSNWLLFLC